MSKLKVESHKWSEEVFVEGCKYEAKKVKVMLNLINNEIIITWVNVSELFRLNKKNIQ